MVTNLLKTKAVFFCKELTNVSLQIVDENFKFSNTMKMLGVKFNHKLKFSHHILKELKNIASK